MENKIILNGNDESFLSISLSDILSKIDKGEEFEWKLLFLEATTETDLDILNLEKKINESDSGYLISWSDLVKLSNQIYQIIEILLIGSKNSKNLKRYISEDEMRVHCDFCIELIDSSYWEVGSKNKNLLNNLKSLEK